MQYHLQTKVTVGCKVALNLSPDATWFRVVALDGTKLIIREDDGSGEFYAAQTSDTSLVKQVRA